jgi:4-methyl-5(b-hydroxyethyl)-thiazole monophosphate biosynthesis
MSHIAVLLADGFEEVEAVTPIDFLRRAGVEVIVTGVDTEEPQGARGVVIRTDSLIGDLSEELDGVVLPGGMPGAENLAASKEVQVLTERLFTAGKLVASICAAPAVALGKYGILKGRRFTCYPGFETRVTEGTFVEERVVVDGNLITSRGPGTAAEFSIAVIDYLVDSDSAKKVFTTTLQKR